ncbi:MAG: heavy-metal-associated domain-containing protein [Bacteroidetes bacterium]|nr:heavy-metal-associated domain-containing protein [Bacteroidota bacterium]
MFNKIVSVAIFFCLLTVSVFAKDIQKTNLKANIECNNCKNKVEKTLKSTKGVEKVNVNMKDQSVQVEYDKAVVSEEELVAVLNKADAKLDAKAGCSTKKDAKAGCNKPCNAAEKKACSKENKKDGEGCQKKCNK